MKTSKVLFIVLSVVLSVLLASCDKYDNEGSKPDEFDI